MDRNPAVNAGDMGSSPRPGRVHKPISPCATITRHALLTQRKPACCNKDPEQPKTTTMSTTTTTTIYIYIYQLCIPSMNNSKRKLRKQLLELPRWLSGKESAHQCRRHRFDPWSGKIPHAVEQLNHNYSAPMQQVLKPSTLKACAPQQEKPMQSNYRVTPTLCS